MECSNALDLLEQLLQGCSEEPGLLEAILSHLNECEKDDCRHEMAAVCARSMVLLPENLAKIDALVHEGHFVAMELVQTLDEGDSPLKEHVAECELCKPALMELTRVYSKYFESFYLDCVEAVKTAVSAVQSD